MRFSIGTMLGVTAVLALVMATLLAFPDDLASLSLIVTNVVFASALLATVVFGSGRLRAFALGAMVPFVSGAALPSVMLALRRGFRDPMDVGDFWEFITSSTEVLKAISVTLWTLAIVAGFTSVFVQSRLQDKA